MCRGLCQLTGPPGCCSSLLHQGELRFREVRAQRQNQYALALKTDRLHCRPLTRRCWRKTVDERWYIWIHLGFLLALAHNNLEWGFYFLFVNFCALAKQKELPTLVFPPRRGWGSWVASWPHSSRSQLGNTGVSILQLSATVLCCHDSLGMPWSFLVYVEILFAWNKKAAHLDQAAIYVRETYCGRIWW